MGRAGIIATVTGCIASGVGFLVYTIAFSLDAKSFADEAVQTSGAARDAVSGPAVQAVHRKRSLRRPWARAQPLGPPPARSPPPRRINPPRRRLPPKLRRQRRRRLRLQSLP